MADLSWERDRELTDSLYHLLKKDRENSVMPNHLESCSKGGRPACTRALAMCAVKTVDYFRVVSSQYSRTLSLYITQVGLYV